MTRRAKRSKKADEAAANARAAIAFTFGFIAFVGVLCVVDAVLSEEAVG